MGKLAFDIREELNKSLDDEMARTQSALTKITELKAKPENLRTNEEKVDIANIEKDIRPVYLDKNLALSETLTKIKRAIKEEVSNDPAKIGYQGKNAQEIADLLNRSYDKYEIDGQGNYILEDKVLQERDEFGNVLSEQTIKVKKERVGVVPAPRINVIFADITFAPNVIDDLLVDEALKDK